MNFGPTGRQYDVLSDVTGRKETEPKQPTGLSPGRWLSPRLMMADQWYHKVTKQTSQKNEIGGMQNGNQPQA